jgi:hypothetical protein
LDQPIDEKINSVDLVVVGVQTKSFTHFFRCGIVLLPQIGKQACICGIKKALAIAKACCLSG